MNALLLQRLVGVLCNIVIGFNFQKLILDVQICSNLKKIFTVTMYKCRYLCS